jgi:hypothetical protein
VRTFRKTAPEELLKDERITIDNNVITGTHSYNYGASYTQLNQINVPAVHDLGYTGAGITICLMDAGFSLLSHEVFDNMNIVDTWDFVNGDADVGNGSDMGDGSHGTETLSTIGGFKEGELIGPAFGANYLLAKTENSESETPVEEDNWVAALEWADDLGVDVTSTSLGYIDFDPPYDGYTWEDMDGKGGVWRKYTKQELLELSLVSVPANPEALSGIKTMIKAFDEGILTEKDMECVGGECLIREVEKEVIKEKSILDRKELREAVKEALYEIKDEVKYADVLFGGGLKPKTAEKRAVHIDKDELVGLFKKGVE